MIYFKDYFGFTNWNIRFIFSERKNIFFYLYTPMGLIYLYLYIKVKYYLTIENNIIKQNYIFGKKIDLSEIKSIEHLCRRIYFTDRNKKKVEDRL